MQKELKLLGEFILKEMARALILQGHVASGTLVQSLEARVVGDSLLQGLMEDYGVQMDLGRKPGNYVPIDALVRWIEQKGIQTGNRSARQVAFAISNAIRKEGIPTRGSRARFGKRTGFLTDTLNRLQPEIEFRINEMVGGQIDTAFTNLVKEVQAA